jgi:DNA-binding transcriptional regulator YhcF (GntR family)
VPHRVADPRTSAPEKGRDTVTEPASARIAADLRRRISRGDLAPGERVPSTRELTQQWGVAMATATKALTILRQEGLVRSVRGVGTVVAERERPQRTRQSATGPAAERIVDTAIRVADAEGLATMSMRRLAAELGLAPMSLYQYVASKDDLVLLMIDRAFGEEPLPARPPASWRAALETSSRTQWACFRRHPWLAPAMSLTRPQAVPSALAHTEWALQALDGRGLDPVAAFTVHITLFGYVRGMAINLESENQAEAETGMTKDEWVDAHLRTLGRLMETGHFPMVERITSGEFDFDLDALFEFGLQRMLDGLRDLLAPETPRDPDQLL